jgi:hypothetical protein
VTPPDRPWWASDGAGGDQDVDPLEAHRRARRPDADVRGTPSEPGPGDADPVTEASWWAPATEAVTRLARELTADATTTAGAGEAPTGEAPTGETPTGEAPTGDATTGDPSEGAGPAREATAGAAGPGGAGNGGGGPHRIDACGVCPICTAIRTLGATHPELVTHLAEAARHLALAVRTVVDAATDDREAAAPRRDRRDRDARGGSRGDGLQHIDLDGE